MYGDILLVEDDDSLARAISLKLSHENYHVHTAETISEAESVRSQYLRRRYCVSPPLLVFFYFHLAKDLSGTKCIQSMACATAG